MILKRQDEDSNKNFVSLCHGLILGDQGNVKSGRLLEREDILNTFLLSVISSTEKWRARKI